MATAVRPPRLIHRPTFAGSIRTPGHPSSKITYKALALEIRGYGLPYTYVFDTQNMRFVGAWHGKSVRLTHEGE